MIVGSKDSYPNVWDRGKDGSEIYGKADGERG